MMPEFVDIEFEVIDDFYNSFLVLPHLVENDYLTNKAIAEIIWLYNHMEMTFRNSEPWIHEMTAFKSHQLWQNIRQRAGTVLIEVEKSIKKE